MGGASGGGAGGRSSGSGYEGTGKDQHKTPVGAIVGGILAAVAVVIVSALAIFLYIRRRRVYSGGTNQMQTRAVSSQDILQGSGTVVGSSQYNTVPASATVVNSSQFDVTEHTPVTLTVTEVTPAPTAPSYSAGGGTGNTKCVKALRYHVFVSDVC